MSESVYLLLAIAAVAGYLLVFSEDRPAQIRSHEKEIKRIIRRGEQEMDRIYDDNQQFLEELKRRSQQ